MPSSKYNSFVLAIPQAWEKEFINYQRTFEKEKGFQLTEKPLLSIAHKDVKTLLIYRREDVSRLTLSVVEKFVRRWLLSHEQHFLLSFIEEGDDEVVYYGSTRLQEELANLKRRKVETSGSPKMLSPKFDALITIDAVNRRIVVFITKQKRQTTSILLIEELNALAEEHGFAIHSYKETGGGNDTISEIFLRIDATYILNEVILEVANYLIQYGLDKLGIANEGATTYHPYETYLNEQRSENQ